MQTGKSKNRIFSLLLALALVIGIAPLPAMAGGNAGGVTELGLSLGLSMDVTAVGFSATEGYTGADVPAKTVTITNHGSSPISGLGVQVTNPQLFTVTGPALTVLPANASTTFSIQPATGQTAGSTFDLAELYYNNTYHKDNVLANVDIELEVKAGTEPTEPTTPTTPTEPTTPTPPTAPTEPGAVAVTGVTLDPESAAMAVGGTIALTATVSPANATDKTVTWDTLDPAVATVDDKGVVTAISVGVTTIEVVTTDGQKYASSDIVVYDPAQVDIGETEDTSGAGLSLEAEPGTMDTIVNSLPQDVLNAVASGEKLTVTLAVAPLDEGSLDADEKDKITQAMATGESLGMILDIKLMAQAGSAQGSLTELSDPITLSFPVPEELRGQNLDFRIISVHHDGSVTVYDNISADPAVIAFQVDKFSTFALTYAESVAVDGYTVTVNNSYAANSGSGSYREGETVTIRAGSRRNYAFNGWSTSDGVTFANAGSATTTFPMPARNVTVTASWRYAGSGIVTDGNTTSSSSSGSGGSGGGGGAAVVSPQADVTVAAATATAKKAAQEAKASGAALAIVKLRNPRNISIEAIRAMVTAANMPSKVYADTMNGSLVDVRIAFNPADAKNGVNLYGSTSSRAALARKAFFEKWFGNQVTVISLGQQGSFGFPVEIAARIDEALDSSSLVFYAYDKASNTYRRIAAPNYRVDNNGYVHFTTELAGDIIVTDKPLAAK